MTQAARQRTGLVARAVREAVGALAAPSLRDAVIRRAIRMAGLDAVPEGADRVRSFFEIELFSAVFEYLGEDAAVTMLAQLLPIASLLELPNPLPSTLPPGHVRRAREDSAGNVLETGSRAARRQASAVRVLLSTTDRGRFAALLEQLAGLATVVPVIDTLGLLQSVAATGADAPRLIVLDCHSPSIPLTEALMLRRDFPEETRVLLWGEPSELTFEERHSIPQRWLLSGASMDARDVAAIFRVLMS